MSSGNLWACAQFGLCDQRLQIHLRDGSKRKPRHQKRHGTLRGEVIVVEDRDPAGGYLGTRLKKIDQILQSDPKAIWLNQYANMANKNVHAEQTANEIAREFDKVDWVFVGAGTTGTIAGISERLRQVFPKIKVVAVEPAGSVTFGGAPGKRNIPGIGTSVRPKLADLVNPDKVVTVSEEQTVETCLSFVRDHHLLVGGSTGNSPWPRYNNSRRSSAMVTSSSPYRRILAKSISTRSMTRPG